MTDTEALRAKIRDLTPDQIEEVYAVLAGGRNKFFDRMHEILAARRVPSGYLTDDQIKMVLGELADEDYVRRAIKQVTEGN